MTIGFIGNFTPTFSTENDRKWSFEKLGHEVRTYQENKTTAGQLLEDMNELDMLVYSHTHDPSYVIQGLKEVFSIYRANKVPTVSVHLDRWLGLKRVTDMGNEATWFTEYIFMADASPEAAQKYDELKLNWYYLQPAVVERDCYMAQADHDKYPHDIVFVGSKGYHPEYSFRPQLVDFLHQTYEDRFAHYGNDGLKVIRGDELNEVYASAAIAVGDSCFGGRENYVSDRYYETRGRGGFLLHPEVKGVDSIGVAHYAAQDLDDLKQQIDYYLEHQTEREQLRLAGFEQVRNHETYTQRAEEMLAIIFK